MSTNLVEVLLQHDHLVQDALNQSGHGHLAHSLLDAFDLLVSLAKTFHGDLDLIQDLAEVFVVDEDFVDDRAPLVEVEVDLVHLEP